jgi:hypothetical protein
MNVVIISTFKPFLKEFKIEQTNAIRSWKKLRCNPKIVIIGDDQGVEEICKKENIINHPLVKKDNNGTPLVADIFEKGWKYATEDDICIFVNGDIILTDSLCDTLDRFVNEYSNYKDIKYMITAIRFDWINYREIDFENTQWENDINKDIIGQYAPPTAGDIFIHKKNTFTVPHSGIAKMCYDSWIMGYANKYFDITINATSSLKIYHQLGKWYQNNKVCERRVTKEMTNNYHRFAKIFKEDSITRTKVTDCEITW